MDGCCARRVLARDEHSTRCGRSHLREKLQGLAVTRGGETRFHDRDAVEASEELVMAS